MRQLLVLLAVALCACAEPELKPRTQVVAVVYADPSLSPRLGAIEAEVRDESGARTVSAHRFELSTGDITLPLSFGVYQPSAGADWFMLVARGIDQAGSTLVEYKVIAQFVSGETGLLPVVLSASCVGMLCEGKLAESCYGDVGRCVPVSRVVPEVQLGDAGTSELPTPVSDASTLTDQDAGPVDAGSVVAAAVAPSSHGFGSTGGRRGDGTVSVYADGFELGERRCTVDRQYCVTGSLVP
jgi:hypothetical protein